MIFLVEYDRPTGRIVKLEEYTNANRRLAEQSRLQSELDLKRAGVEHEVVLLDAANEDALRKTHQRYFEDLRGISRLSFGGAGKEA